MIICLCKTITKQDMIREVINGCKTFELMVKSIETKDDCKICYCEAKKAFNKLKNAYESNK